MKNLKPILIIAILFTAFAFTSCKKKAETPPQTLSAPATHSVRVTTNSNLYEVNLNSTHITLDVNHRATFTAKGGDILKVVSTYTGFNYFINMYIDGSTSATVSGSYSQDGTLTYTFP